MNLHLSGETIPQVLLDVFSALTDHSRLLIGGVIYSTESQAVTLPIIRFPLRKLRPILGNLFDQGSPIESVVTLRNVTRIAVEDLTDNSQIPEITILFGITFKRGKVVVSSAEECNGRPCYLLETDISQIDLSLIDRAIVVRD